MKLILIFLISILGFGCVTQMKQYQEVPSTLYVPDMHDQMMDGYDVKGEDNESCKLRLAPIKPRIPFVDPKLKDEGLVCFKAKDYQNWRNAQRVRCENKKKK